MKITNSIIAILALLLSVNSYAARVTQSKNGKIMIDLEGDSAAINQNIILINAQNKKVAIAQINQIKNGKAIGTIRKGQSLGNEKIMFASSKSEAAVQAETNQVFRTNSKRMSVVATLMTNTMTTKQSNTSQTEDVAMKGSTVGVTGIFEWPLIPSVSLRTTLGYEPFKTSGTATITACANLTSTECTAEITYLSAGGYVRFDFTQSRTQFWGAAGGVFKYPIGKTTTALKADDIKMTMTYGVGLGLDFFLTNKTFIPFSVEQQMFLKSDTVTASITMIRLGYGLTF